jgi:hypothetical protein
VQPCQRLRHDEHSHSRRHQFDGVRRRSGTLDRGQPRPLLPFEGVVERVQDDVVGEVLGGHLVDGGHGVVLRDQHHRGLGVEGDRAEIGPVDR